MQNLVFVVKPIVITVALKVCSLNRQRCILSKESFVGGTTNRPPKKKGNKKSPNVSVGNTTNTVSTLFITKFKK